MGRGTAELSLMADATKALGVLDSHTRIATQ